MDNRKKIEDILLTDYGCFDDLTVDKLCDLSIVSHRRELLLAFYQYLIDNDPFPINSFSKEREVDRFLKANNGT